MSRQTILSILAGAALVAGCGDGSSPTGTTSLPTTREGRWEQDLDTLARELPARHTNLFFQVSRSRFEAAVSELRADIPALDDAQIVVGLMRIVAMVGDSHTTVGTNRFFVRQVPLRFEWFPDGIFVVAATETYRELLGAQVARVGDVPIEAVTEALRELVPHENEPWLRLSLVSLLEVPEILRAQALVPDGTRVTLQLDGATPPVVEVPAEPRTGLELVGAGLAALPLYRQRPDDNYWLSVLEDSQTVYVQYRRASDMAGETVSQFAGRVLQILDTSPVRTLVIDLRNNPGGNSSLLDPLISGLVARPRWSGGDGLYVIIGKRTFSSAILNAVSLEQRARAILVGEPTGGKPNHFGEVRSFELPNSRLSVSYSTRFFTLIAGADPPSLEPDVLVETTSADFVEGRDPVLDIILALTGN